MLEEVGSLGLGSSCKRGERTRRERGEEGGSSLWEQRVSWLGSRREIERMRKEVDKELVELSFSCEVI